MSVLTTKKDTSFYKDSAVSQESETVLINQGGGSLGAYECGVCKVLSKHNLHFDIIAGSSIGAINATILAANYSQRYGIRDAAKILEDFWIDISEKYSPFCTDKQRSELAALNALFWGNPKAFTPIWIAQGGLPYYYFFNSPYLYNVDLLRNTIKKYVDFTRLCKRSNQHQQKQQHLQIKDDSGFIRSHLKENTEDNRGTYDLSSPRLILASTNIQTGKPVIFDNDKMDITIDHVMASAGYAIYGLPWTKINDDYFWDGSFIHNTPLSSVIKASPKHEKIVYVTDVFPRKQHKLPSSMPETYHRVRDLIFCDTSIQQVGEVSDILKEFLSLLEQMQEIVLENKNKDEKTKLKVDNIEKEYHKLMSKRRGHLINKLVHIERKESKGHHFLFEDADFSVATIERLIKEGQKDAEEEFLKNQG